MTAEAFFLRFRRGGFMRSFRDKHMFDSWEGIYPCERHFLLRERLVC